MFFIIAHLSSPDHVDVCVQRELSFAGMDPVTGQPIRPGHPMWQMVQTAAEAHLANQSPVLLNRSISDPNDIADELGRIAQEGVAETVRYLLHQTGAFSISVEI